MSPAPEPPLNGLPHPAIKRALEAYLGAAQMTHRALVDDEPSATVRHLYAARLRLKGMKALAEFCRGPQP